MDCKTCFWEFNIKGKKVKVFYNRRKRFLYISCGQKATYIKVNEDGTLERKAISKLLSVIDYYETKQLVSGILGVIGVFKKPRKIQQDISPSLRVM